MPVSYLTKEEILKELKVFTKNYMGSIIIGAT